MSRSILRLALAAAISVSPRFGDAQETGKPRPSVDREHEFPGVLMLIGGRLVEGHITETAGGYLVELPQGRYVVPRERVLLSARDRLHAYDKQRAAMRPPSPSNHEQLARWCLRYGMLEEAKIELRDALRLAANFAPAREMLVDLEQMERPDDARHQHGEPAAGRTSDGYDVPEAVSIAGLSSESVRAFTTRVQPLLVNGCGNARCHGGTTGDNAFRLERVRFGHAGNRTETLRNLAAALAFVDGGEPLASPLLVRPSGVHGGATRPVFDGPAGRRQRELLKEWIATAAADLAREGGVDTQAVSANRAEETPERASAATPSRATGEPPGDLLDRILDEERPDAFDPAAFNGRSETLASPR